MLLIIQFSTVFVRLEFDYVALSMSSSLILCQGLAPGFQFPAWVRTGQSRACNWIQQGPLSFSASLSQSPLFLCTSVKLPSFPVYDPIGRAHQLPHDVIKPEASTGHNIKTVPPRKSLSFLPPFHVSPPIVPPPPSFFFSSLIFSFFLYESLGLSSFHHSFHHLALLPTPCHVYSSSVSIQHTVTMLSMFRVCKRTKQNGTLSQQLQPLRRCSDLI